MLKLFQHSARITAARMGDFARPLYPYIGRLLRAVAGQAAKETTRRNFVKASGGMCEAQRVDYAAASAGKITWRAYHARWGHG